MITVFYDGKCGLCAREIAHYRRIATPGAFTWVDITELSTPLEALGISLAEGLKILHAQDADGQLHKSVDAFLLIWRQLRYWRMLALMVSLPGIYHLAKLSYRWFASWRFSRLTHCQIAANEEHI